MTEGTQGAGGLIRQVSEQLADVVENAGASIVGVDARRRQGASGIVWSGEHVVTADHVVEQEEGIAVAIGDGDARAATIVGRDSSSDLAVLRVEGLTAEAIHRGATPRVGSLALLVARPGRALQASFGAVGAVESELRRRRSGASLDVIRVDATFYPGFSGGALVDVDGLLLGMATSGFGRGTGTGIVIGLATIERVVDSLVQHGRIRRGYLGITSQPVEIPESMRAALGAGQTRGLLILDVASDSPAARGGMLLGDTLVSIAGEPIGGTDDLRTQLTAERVGQTVPVLVLRGGQLQQLSATIGEQS